MVKIEADPNKVTPSARCVHCGRHLEAESRDELWLKYSNHVKSEHGKPDMRNPDGSYRYL